MNNLPIYVINLAATKKTFWTPEIYQIFVGQKNESYLNSLWIGTGWNLLSAPYRVFREIVCPVFNFRFGLAAMSLVNIPVTMMKFLKHGLLGRAIALNIDVEQAVMGVVLSEQQAQEALEMGHDFVCAKLDDLEMPA